MKERYIQMSKAYEEMKKAEKHLSLVCGCYDACVNCPLNLSVGECALTKLCAAIKEQQLRDLRAEAYGEVM